MMLVKLMLLAFMGTAIEPDPTVLVERLGSGKYAEREAASRDLERQGRIALVALRKAKEAKDPEVRVRAVALVDKIESRLMVHPTMITLDYQDRPLVEVVKAIGDQAKVPLVLNPENSPIWQHKRITLKEPEPVTFWNAIDKLCQAAGLQSNPGVPLPGPMPPYRVPTLSQNQLEILDSKGQVYPQWYPTTSRVDQEEVRMTVRLIPLEGVGPPAKIRYYDLVRAAAEASFEFHGVAMP